MGASRIDAFAEAEALVDEFGSRPPGSDAERRTAQHLARRLEELGREVHLEGFSVWPQWATAYAINAGLAVVGGVLAVYSAALGTGLVLLALILTFLDAAGITPTTRRLLGRRASQNVVSFGEREMPGALVLVAHYDSGPTRTRPLPPMFISMLIVLVCCVARVADLDHCGVHVVFTGAQKTRAQGMRAFLQTHRMQFAPGETIVINVDAVGGGELRETKKEGPLLTVKSHPQLTGNLESEPFVNREPSDGYAAASAGLPSVTFAGTTDRLEEDNLTETEEACVRLIEEMDEELG